MNRNLYLLRHSNHMDRDHYQSDPYQRRCKDAATQRTWSPLFLLNPRHTASRQTRCGWADEWAETPPSDLVHFQNNVLKKKSRTLGALFNELETMGLSQEPTPPTNRFSIGQKDPHSSDRLCRGPLKKHHRVAKSPLEPL